MMQIEKAENAKPVKPIKEEKTRGVRGILLKMLAGGIVGGIVGGFIGYYDSSLRGITSGFNSHWISAVQHLLLPGLIVITLLSIILQENVFRKLKKICRSLETAEDEDFFKLDYEEERNGAFLLGINITSMVLCTILFAFGYSLDYLTRSPAMESCAIFIICFAYCGCMQARYIKLMQTVHPEKRGNYASSKFQQQWLESCDEAEKQIIYQSAYKAYTLTSRLAGLLMIVTMAANLIFHTGIFATIVVGIIYLVLNLSYCRSCVRLKKVKVDR